jgi:hypothetical protein
MRRKKLNQKTKDTVKVSPDGRALTYRPLGRQDLEAVTIEVGTFVNYQGQTILVESIDRKTFDLTCSDSDGGALTIGFDSPDAVNV